MFGIKFIKAQPNTYFLQYKKGKIVREGAGLSFFYFSPASSLVAVPMASVDIPFIFNEVTSDFQEISIQGQLSYRLVAPTETATVLDYTIDPKTRRYLSKDPEKLVSRVINAVQANTRSGVNNLSLDEALIKVKELTSEVLASVQNEPKLKALGVVIESLYFTAVKATPEMQKALEADYRESLQQRSDLAIYTRRKAAVAEESKIKNSELDNEVELEERRRDLVAKQSENRIKQAQAEAKAIEMEAEAETKADEIRYRLYKDLSPQSMVGLALKEWAANAGPIDNLTITPDLVSKVVCYIGGNANEQ